MPQYSFGICNLLRYTDKGDSLRCCIIELCKDKQTASLGHRKDDSVMHRDLIGVACDLVLFGWVVFLALPIACLRR